MPHLICPDVRHALQRRRRDGYVTGYRDHSTTDRVDSCGGFLQQSSDEGKESRAGAGRTDSEVRGGLEGRGRWQRRRVQRLCPMGQEALGWLFAARAESWALRDDG